jgi:hypothetical protein
VPVWSRHACHPPAVTPPADVRATQKRGSKYGK